jgi:hypothetical protein
MTEGGGNMEASGVDLVAGGKLGFVLDVLQRMEVCNSGRSLDDPVGLCASFEGILREKLGDFLHLVECRSAIKVDSDLLIVGLEFEEGAEAEEADWDEFDDYGGTELVSEPNEWGIAVTSELVDSLIYDNVDYLLSNLTGESMENISEVELTDIEWPGDKIRLKGNAIYDLDCPLGTIELDIEWEVSLTLKAEDSKLSVEWAVTDAKPLYWYGYAELVLCGVLWGDLLVGFLIDFGVALSRILGQFFMPGSDLQDWEEKKILLVDLCCFVQTGQLVLDEPTITTDGVTIKGKRVGESGSSVTHVPSEVVLERVIHTPFACLRPSRPIYGVVQVSNDGGASLAICSASLDAGDEGFVTTGACGWEVLTAFCDSTPLIILPGEHAFVRVCCRPWGVVEFNVDYRTTLVLSGFSQTVDEEGKGSYAAEESRVSLVARYHCQPYDAQFDSPEIGLGYDPELVLIDALFDDVMYDLISRIPWKEVWLPDDAIEIIDLMTDDALVSAMRILDTDENAVAQIESALPAKHLSFALERGQSYSLALKSGIGEAIPSQPHRREDEAMGTTLVECRKYVLMPMAKLPLDDPINHAFLSANWLFVATGEYLVIYDVRDPSVPRKVHSKRFDTDIVGLDVARGTRTKGGGRLLVGVGKSGLSSFELLSGPAGKPTIYQAWRSHQVPDLQDTFKVLFHRSKCVTLAKERLALFDTRGSGRLELLSTLQVDGMIYDADVKRDVIFIGTNQGIEVVDLKHCTAPKRVGIHKTDDPVLKLQVRGPILYATQAKGGTLLLDCSNFRALKPAGWYQRPVWSSYISMEGDVGVAISDDKRSFRLFSKQAVSPDSAKLQR